MPLTTSQVSRAWFLFVKYVSKTGPMDLAHAHACVLREKRAAESGAVRVSPGLLTELRNECRELAVLTRSQREP